MIKFIELSSNPKILDFMENRKKFLKLLGIKDLAVEEAFSRHPTRAHLPDV